MILQYISDALFNGMDLDGEVANMELSSSGFSFMSSQDSGFNFIVEAADKHEVSADLNIDET